MGRQRQEQLIAPPLMIAFAMIVLDELADGSAERTFTDQNHPVQAGFLDGPYEALRVRVEIRGTGRQADHLHTCGGECLPECHGEQWIPIVDQKPLAPETAIAGIRDVATRLV